MKAPYARTTRTHTEMGVGCDVGEGVGGCGAEGWGGGGVDGERHETRISRTQDLKQRPTERAVQHQHHADFAATDPYKL